MKNNSSSSRRNVIVLMVGMHAVLFFKRSLWSFEMGLNQHERTASQDDLVAGCIEVRVQRYNVFWSPSASVLPYTLSFQTECSYIFLPFEAEYKIFSSCWSSVVGCISALSLGAIRYWQREGWQHFSYTQIPPLDLLSSIYKISEPFKAWLKTERERPPWLP